LQIRAAASADAPGIAELMAAAGHSPTAVDWAARLDAFQRDSGVVLLTVEWGPPSGIIALNRAQTMLSDRPVAHIDLLLVDPEARRRGIGRLLLKAAAQAARAAGCDMLHLTAPGDETSLRAFSEANGFVQIDASFVRPLRKRSDGSA
jgi:GNAT superfamily N-acetyltransferase